MCPTQYNRGWADDKPGTYLDILGEQLDPSVHIMWTGDPVCHDITLEGQEWVNKRIKRPSYVWWNFPVTDYCRSNLCMGALYGLPQESGSRESMSGLVSNPMDKPEASKVTLFGIADYAWNINGFKSDEAWKEGIVPLSAGCGGHAGICGPQLRPGPQRARLPARGIREHSPRGHPRAGSRPGGRVVKSDTALLKKEFSRMAAAAPVIREKVDNPRLMKEIGAWVDAFEQLGMAGQHAVAALENSSPKAAVTALVKATQALAAMDRISREHNQQGQLYRSAVKTGSRVMTPAVNELADIVSRKTFPSLSERPPSPPGLW